MIENARQAAERRALRKLDTFRIGTGMTTPAAPEGYPATIQIGGRDYPMENLQVAGAMSPEDVVLSSSAIVIDGRRPMILGGHAPYGSSVNPS